MNVYVESRHKRHRWLPRWWPDNVYSMTFMGEVEWQEAEDMVVFAREHGAFAALAYGDHGLIATSGSVRIEQVC